MTAERIILLCAYYVETLKNRGIDPREANPKHTTTTSNRLAHVSWMCHQIVKMLDEDHGGGAREKPDRDLGFVQGVLWEHGVFSISEMRLHNKPHPRLPDTIERPTQ